MSAKLEMILTIRRETTTISTKPKTTNQQQQRQQHINNKKQPQHLLLTLIGLSFKARFLDQQQQQKPKQ